MTNYVISFNHYRFALTIELLPLYMVLEMMIGAAGIGTRTAFKQLEHCPNVSAARSRGPPCWTWKILTLSSVHLTDKQVHQQEDDKQIIQCHIITQASYLFSHTRQEN